MSRSRRASEPTGTGSGAESWTLEGWDAMWRPGMWLRAPPREHRPHVIHLVAIIALTGYANVVANRFLDDFWTIPFNLGILVVAVALGRHAGATWTDLGMRRDRVRRGLTVGVIAFGSIAVVLALGVAIPATREFFRDDRVVESSTALVLFDAFVRVPLATALYEEALFRGVIFGMLVRRWSPLWAALGSSVIFGLWHVLPTLSTLDVNPAGGLFDGVTGTIVAVSGGVVTTFVAGLGFVWLRLRANSVVAPILAHIATNSFALLGALAVVEYLS